MNFKIEKKLKNSLGRPACAGRAGVLATAHGEIQTPAFVAVGTKATVKSLTPEQIAEAGSQVVLANTYHLYLEPGEKIIKEHGGLSKFMNWSGPTMTDSGGFQAFSLGVAYGKKLSKFMAAESPEAEEIAEAYDQNKIRAARVTEDGVEFKSIIDGSSHFFTPEKSIQIQNDLGADIIFAFDECTSPHADKKYLREAMERTHRWAERCLIENSKLKIENSKPQVLFGIVQGGRHEDLRKESAKTISKMVLSGPAPREFEGFGIGGSFVKEDMATAVKWVNEILPEEKPRHLLGVGEPIDLILGVENGCDIFDCVAATRMARNGSLYTKHGKININNSKYKNILEPIETHSTGSGQEVCGCYTCLSRPNGGTNYTVAYLSHLFRAKEMLASTLASIHNLYFLNHLMFQIRQSILDNKFFEFKERFLENYRN